jgi:hypothetical protein
MRATVGAMSLVDQALDTQLEIIQAFKSDYGGPIYEWLMRTKEYQFLDEEGNVMPGGNHGAWKAGAKELARLLALAPTYVVTADMGRLLDVAVDQLQAEGATPIPTVSEMPSPSGFLLMERPTPIMVYGPEPQGYLPVRAMAWVPQVVTYMQHGEQKHGPGVSLLNFLDTKPGDAVASGPFHMTKPHDLTAWTFDLPWVVAESHEDFLHTVGDPIGNGKAHPAGAHWRRWAYSIWHLAMERIQPRKAGRHTRRRWERVIGPSPNFGDVRVIDLRRYATRGGVAVGETDPDYARQWSHRWVVSGHWRQQPYGPGRTLRKTIWIDPFVKGPDDRPLIVRDDVYVMRR